VKTSKLRNGFSQNPPDREKWCGNKCKSENLRSFTEESMSDAFPTLI